MKDRCKPEDHVEDEATGGTWQRMITACREPDRPRGKDRMGMLITSVNEGVPAALVELRRLKDPEQRAGDVLAYVDRPGTSTAGRVRADHSEAPLMGIWRQTQRTGQTPGNPGAWPSDADRPRSRETFSALEPS